MDIPLTCGVNMCGGVHGLPRADILAAQNKALGAVFKYEENIGKVVKEARETGSWEGAREKFEELTMDLAKKVGAIFSEDRLGEWEEKYRPIVERILSL